MENQSVISYESPQVRIIEVEVEKGFATSSTDSIDTIMLTEDGEW